MDGCNTHRGIVAVTICNIVLKAKKPDRKPYPKELKTYGDHLRQIRLERNLNQPQVAKILGVDVNSIANWEMNRITPRPYFIPKIISFLGYAPEIIENPIKRYRIERGITQKEMARILEIDPTTLAKIEIGRNRRMCHKIRLRLSLLEFE